MLRKPMFIYGATLAAVIVATVARWLLDPALGDQLPYPTFFVAVIFAAWIGGLRPAILATGLGFVVAWYCFIPPRFSLFGTSSLQFLGLGMYLMVSFAIAAFGEAMRVGQRRFAEQAERLRTTLASIGDGVITTDTAGRIISMNAVAESLTGWANADAVGQSLDTVFNIVNEGTRKAVENPAFRALKEGVIVGLANHTVLICKDGTERPIDDSAAPIRCKEGEVIGCVLVFRDNTERHRADEALRRKEERFRLASDAVNGIIYDVDLLTGHVERTRGLYEVLGYQPDEVPPTAAWWAEQIHPDDRERVTHVDPISVRGDAAAIEYRVRHRDGRWLHVEDRGVLMQDGGTAVRLVGCTTDITARKEAEERLCYSEERHRIAFDQSPTGVVYVGTDKRFIKVNPAMCEITGYSDDELLRMTVADLTHPDDRTADAEFLDGYMSGVTSLYENEERYLRKDGGVRWVCVTARMVKDAEGRPSHSLGVVQDITARKEAEETLRFQLDLTKSITDNATTAIFMMDDESRCTFMNPAAERMTGFTLKEVEGGVLHDFIHHHRPDGRPYPMPECPIDRALPENGEVRDHEDVFFRKNGEKFPVCCNARVIVKGGVAVGTVIEVRDITKEKEAESERRDGEQRMRLATEATNVGIWEWNVVTGQIRWDAQMFRIYGLPPTPNECVPYSAWSGAVLSEDLPRQEEVMQETVRCRGSSSREFRIRRASDGECWVVQSVETVRTDANGQVEWVVGTNLDITERRRAEDELRRLAAELSEADRKKNEFLATLAHELRNPLAPIRNGLQLMKLAGDDAEAVDQARNMMERQVRQMVRLVDDLLDVSRISQGKIQLKKEQLQLEAVVRSAVETSRPLIEQLGHELTVMLPMHPVVVDADLTRLAQVFLNLLNNAAKYSDQGGRILLKCERQGSDVVVAVRDTGIGIAADQLPHIFEMFSQVDGSLEKSQGGLGIGLTLVKRLVEMHGGRVEAHSEGLGKGSEFVVRLPVVVEASALSDREEKQDARKSSLRILIVDDNRDSADSLSMMLKIMGNDTRTAYDGEEAVASANEFRPEVILLDIGLPKLNGYEACRRIREQPCGKSLVIIAQTGWGQDEDRQRTHDAGFDHHMVKPVDPQNLMNLLAGLSFAATK